ncbi:MFS transporter [Cupriavidus numazuensis]|uniref:Niacin/nicotinamide transporter NaiP n=1 Tax=Cupriavidus numazuensis TaxID=221992 RepID=A0ABM8TLB4_9BURK|nr:MFS transporter [Cupriavidus numazuensis]CAG2153251.1 Putative niacin/nicotinamide transporter NaiP [Cupriavidus numazuensis]
MFAWYRGGSRQEKRTFWACYFGWALDSFDVQIYSFLVPTLMAAWSLSKGEAGAIGTASLLAAALGGWLAGILSDRIGRVKVLMFTVLWFTLFGVVAGFASTYEQLLVARALQGLGFGGEWAVGAALMAEVTRPEYRGRAMGFVQSGFCLGWIGAVLVATFALAHFPAELGWRIAFWITALPGLLIVLVRLGVPDSQIYVQSARARGTPKASFKSVFQREHLGTCLTASAVVFGLQASSYVVTVWVPSLLADRGLRSSSMIMTIVVMAIGTFLGFAFTASFSDRWGRRNTLLAMTAGSWIVTLAYCFVLLSPWLVQILGLLVGFFVIGMFAAVGPFLSELFPTEVRTTCMGFSYNVAKTLGALAITGVGVVSAHTGLATAIGACCFASYLISTIALLRLPETKGVRLDSVSAPGASLTDGLERPLA